MPKRPCLLTISALSVMTNRYVAPPDLNEASKASEPFQPSSAHMVAGELGPSQESNLTAPPWATGHMQLLSYLSMMHFHEGNSWFDGWSLINRKLKITTRTSWYLVATSGYHGWSPSSTSWQMVDSGGLVVDCRWCLVWNNQWVIINQWQLIMSEW